jgi:tRNA pseudouridine38-40 synthase
MGGSASFRMGRYKLVLAYDGVRFGGWQTQPNAPSIQSLVEEALSCVLREKTAVTASGRTDSGVHALAQTAHFDSSRSFDPHVLQYSLNSLLPSDIRIRSVAPAPPAFHARYTASSKIYRYHLTTSHDPFKKPYALHVRFPLSIARLKEAAAYFVGERDFTSFTNLGSTARNPVRTLYRIDIVEEEDGAYIEFEGNGFLYKMVRNIVGTLLDVCRGKLQPEEIPAIFAAKDRRKAAAAAPAHGLFLVKVNYVE